jgi:6-phosphogluconolactonase
MDFSLHVFPDAPSVARAAAERVVVLSQESIARRGQFSIALAGGSTPRALYELLAQEPFRDHMEWNKTHIFWGDERAVAPDDECSNIRMARLALLDHVPIPTRNIHLPQGDASDLASAARDYEVQLQDLSAGMSTHAGAESTSRLDLVLLGMGDDGHTASLFPGTPGLRETERLVIAVDVAPMQPHVARLTLSFRAINEARHVLVLVTGEAKAELLSNVLEGVRKDKTDIETWPIQGVKPQPGELTWMLDGAAARLVTRND